MIFCCCENDPRRNKVRGLADLNGIDFLEVDDDRSQPNEQRQRRLFVHFLNELQPGALGLDNVRIDGGERIKSIVITSVTSGADDASLNNLRLLLVEVEAPGDFSRYTLRLLLDRRDRTDNAPPPPGFDPILSAVEFEFKVACEGDFDCQQTAACPPEPHVAPDIDYLAKDYASFRQLMLDRMATLAPQWKERNPSDIGVMLVELLAYAGDYLSYKQDAIATEAYLGTARKRKSVRRRARLVDYPMHDGRNARGWVQLAVSQDAQLTAGDVTTRTQFLTASDATAGALLVHGTAEYDAAIRSGATVFELLPDDPLHPTVPLYRDHNTIRFHTWGATDCCLPAGATHADVRGALPNLDKGQVLVFVEVKGPETGKPEDANPGHRHAVRVTKVTRLRDPIGGSFDEPETGALDVTRIEWGAADALPFPLCVSSVMNGQTLVRDVSIALGNIVLADHGITIPSEPLGEVPQSNPALQLRGIGDRCDHPAPRAHPPRFTPFLGRSPVTWASMYSASSPASAAMEPPIERAAPSRMELRDNRDGRWEPRPDLLGSHSSEAHFVVESESDGRASIRFGDDVAGKRPNPGDTLTATYRAGNGTSGNIGADSLRVLVSSEPGAAFVTAVRNPIAARGGIDAESIERVRQNAPYAFRVQERAVTTDDYAAVAKRCSSDIQRATARFRWTGSWRTVFLTVDRTSGAPVGGDFETDLRTCLERYRMAGHDLEIEEPRFVSLDIEMRVCVKRDYFTSTVQTALLDVFSSRILPDGTRGFFHPERFTFGQPVYLSALYATAQAVTGVDSVEIVRFQRQGVDSNDAIQNRRLDIGTLEIARLDNDPNFREHGVLTFTMAGGR